MHPDIRLGVDGPQPLSHGIGLGAAILALQGMQLAVGVGDTDVVHIDQGNRANAAASQGFRRPGAHAAEADNGDVGTAESVQGFAAIEALYAAEAESVVVAGHSVSAGVSHESHYCTR